MLIAMVAMLLGAAEVPQAEAVNVTPDSARAAAAAKYDDKMSKVVCRSEPVLGSRLKKNKVCKTLAEWNLHSLDKQQLRRDLMNRPDPKTF